MCNQECSIYYEYPSANTWNWLEKNFNTERNNSLTIFQLFNNITTQNKEELFTRYFGFKMDELENLCKNDKYSGKKLSPGVMGNPPDRLDGFHCYNSICDCRKTKDKGRSDENMKSYTRDRRAYENFSDGNCLLANVVMGKLNTIKTTCFICHKEDQVMTADHKGPITLGFQHDPLNLQPCCSSCNSSKNNRLTQEDVDKIKVFEEKGINMLSWWAKDAWDKCKNTDNLTIRQILDENTKKFLCIIDWLKKNNPDILTEYINQIYMNHDKSYSINSIQVLPNGDIHFEHSEMLSLKKTKSKQKDRTIEILLEKNEKTNRKLKTTLSETEIEYLSNIELQTFQDYIRHVLG
jgi:Alw26I/Eco31I/Esp3I family type II restriction endonuclease